MDLTTPALLHVALYSWGVWASPALEQWRPRPPSAAAAELIRRFVRTKPDESRGSDFINGRLSGRAAVRVRTKAWGGLALVFEQWAIVSISIRSRASCVAVGFPAPPPPIPVLMFNGSFVLISSLVAFVTMFLTTFRPSQFSLFLFKCDQHVGAGETDGFGLFFLFVNVLTGHGDDFWELLGLKTGRFSLWRLNVCFCVCVSFSTKMSFIFL